MPEPLLSIVTTSYNRASYLGSTIESVLAQEYSDFEYIVVDDCSPDDSLAVARSYANDPRLRVIANETNLGDYGNRNKGLGLARGKYVKFVDCDDVLYPHCVGAMLEVAEAFPEAGVVFVTRERPPWRYPVQLTPEQVYRLHFTEGGVLHQGPLSSLLRREAVLAVGGFPELYTGDVACWLNLTREYPVALMAGGLFWWRQHAGQLSESLRSMSVKWAAHQAEGVRLHWEALGHERCPLPAAERAGYRRRLERDYLRLVVGSALRGRLRVFNELRRGSPFGLLPTLTDLKSSSGVVAAVEVPPSRKPAAGFHVGGVGKPAISVLLPLADGAATMRETIESILSQESDDWELVMVDDASGDGTADFATQVCDGKCVRLIRNATQVGKWAAYNQCGRLARGRLLKYIHVGDTLERRALRDFAWYVTRFPHVGMVVSCADERFLMPLELSPEDLYQAEAMGILSVMENPSGVLYGREAWERAGGFDVACAEAAAKLHLMIGRESPVVFIRGGMVSQAGGSAALRISTTRGRGRPAGELAVLLDALADAGCPLSDSDRQTALAGLERSSRRADWDRRCGQWAVARRLIRLAFPEMPPFAVAAKLVGGEAAFDRSLYPEAM